MSAPEPVPTVGPGSPSTIPATFDEVFAREYPAMVRLAYLMVGSTTSAEDVAQEAFARLLGKWGRVDNPGAYVRTAVLNGARDKLRRRMRRRGPHQTRSRSDQTVGDLDYLGDALAALPYQSRAVIVLRFYEQQTIPEIAAALHMKEGTVKSALHRGLLRLREVIEQ